jgi:hypothetical protein
VNAITIFSGAERSGEQQTGGVWHQLLWRIPAARGAIDGEFAKEFFGSY